MLTLLVNYQFKICPNIFFCTVMKLRIYTINTHAKFQSRQNDGKGMVACSPRVYDLREDRHSHIQWWAVLRPGPGPVLEHILKPTILTTTLRAGYSLVITTFYAGFLTAEPVVFFFVFSFTEV